MLVNVGKYIGFIVLFLTSTYTYSQTSTDFKATRLKGCPPFQTTFELTGSTPEAVYWDFGNGETSTSPTPSITFHQSGLYTIKLIIERVDHSKDTVVKFNYIHVYNKPNLSFVPELIGTCDNNNEVIIQNNSKFTDEFVWDFGDGGSSKLRNPKYKFTASGTYYISLFGKNSQGCTNTITSKQFIQINSSSQSSFELEDVVGCGEDFTFNFLNTSINATKWFWEFSDGTVSDEKEPKKIFPQKGNYSVKLISNNSFGCPDTIFKKDLITVFSKTEPKVQLDKDKGCLPLSVNLKNSTPNTKQITWDFGDGTAIEGLNVIHKYTKPGTFKINILLLDSNNCTTEKTLPNTFTVFSPPWVEVSTSQTIGCSPMKVFVEAKTSNPNLSFEWSLGDGAIIKKKSFDHIYTQTGNFTPTLKLTTSEGCSNIIKANPVKVVNTVANFEIDKTNGCAPLKVKFSNKSTNATTFQWVFGDGGKSTETTPLHSYEKAGSYSISLITKSDFGCTDTLTMHNAIQVTDNPVDIHEPKEIFACAPLDISFMPGALGTDNWLWEFSDGTTSTEKNPFHSFTKPGNYAIKLSSKTNNGCYFTINEFAKIKVESPNANFTTNFTCDSKTIQFENKSTGASSYIWDFGDGITSSEFSPSHTYGSAIRYTAKLIAISENGCSSSKLSNNEVDFLQCIPDSSVVKIVDIMSSTNQDSIISVLQNYFNTIKGCAPLTTQLKGFFKDAVKVNWNFGDGSFSSEKNPTHIYKNPGIYTIKYYAADALGNTIELTFEDKVKVGGVDANFDFKISSDCKFSSIKFSDKTKGTPNYWQWTYEDSLQVFSQNPVLTFNETNTVHPIALIVKDSLGCMDRTYRTVYIGKPQYRFIKPDKICFGDTAKFSSGTNEEYNIQWNFGDGLTSTEKSPFHLYKKTGKYKINVEVQFKNGCFETVNLGKVNIWGPNPNLTSLNTVEVCPGESIHFEALEDSAQTYKWWLDNNQTKTKSGKSISWPIKDQGFHDLSLQVTEEQCSITKTFKNIIKVHDLVVNYKFSQNGDCFPIVSKFTNTSKNIVSSFWEFGDGNTSDEIHPSHTYTSAPEDSIKLTITNTSGCTGSISNSKISYLTSKFDITGENGCAPFEVTFKSILDSSLNYSWNWNFGDGNYSNLSNPIHVYSDTGYFDVSLSVISPKGCSEKTTLKNTIYVSSINSGFELKEISNSKCAPLIAEFKNISVNATSWKWLFGDNKESSSEHPIHFFTKPGNFEISLISYNDYGCIDTFTQKEPIHVPGPIVNFEIEDNLSCTFNQIKFKNLSSGFESILWNFGDGIESTALHPIHSFYEEKPYTITLWAKDSAGCTSFHALSKPINFLPRPNASFSLSDSVGCSPFSSTITNNTTGFKNLKWIIGNNDTITNPINLIQFKNPGKQQVKLIAFSNYGCTDTAKYFPVIVKPSPTANFHANITQGCGPEQQISLINKSIYHGNSHFKWYLNNNFLGLDTNYSIKLPTGLHTVELLVENEYGCVDTALKTDYIEIFDTLTPIATNIEYVTVLNDNDIQIKWEPTSMNGFASYNLYRQNNNSSYGLISKIYDVNQLNFIDDSVKPGQTPYSYKLTTSSFCSKTSSLEDSKEHRTILLKTENISDRKVQIEWSDYKGNKVSSYQIFRNNELLTKNISSDSLFYLDTTAYCNGNYNYRVEAIFDNPLFDVSNSNTRSTSVAGIEKNDQLANVINASVYNDQGVEITWLEPVIGKEIIESYLIYQSTNNGPFEIIDKVEKNNLNYFATRTDVLNDQYVYKIKTVNSCKLVSDFGNGVSTILLKGKNINGEANLSWIPIIGWKSENTTYKIQEKDEYGNWQDQNKIFRNTYQSIFELSKPKTLGFTYRIVGHNEDMISISNTVNIKEDHTLFVPNAFTPNNDGKNDLFRAYGAGIKSFRIKIFNRQGVTVFEANDINKEWDGKFEGNWLSPAIYNYQIHYSDQEGHVNIVKTGNLLLAR